ncbi:diacylglycerol kinase [Rhodovulum adriaticum]|uniref:Diacylglycerol kinase n=1 Tax=Rhodovulum adriaticum TaxID=35804 RepID=A0A4R2NJH1_RHOAD|nr:diacylglycerol kinase [Rhodovulum adriaticum]MBK1634675.1 diacylglycerol kinase [Rhodovulum adriaticum]TCP21617.1 diacylglycerol kinase [Rhodovulum adriaticum]
MRNKTTLKGPARLRAAFWNSLTGLRAIWRSEEAFRLEVRALALSVPLAAWLGQSLVQAVALIGAVLLIVIVEVLNTAIEAVVDRIGPEHHELSGEAKDLGSLAVLLAAILAGMIWLAVLIQRILA